jgi:hypothetical protein
LDFFPDPPDAVGEGPPAAEAEAEAEAEGGV